MKRDLARRIRPLTDQLAQSVAELLERRIDAMIDDVHQAFEIALSAVASEGAEPASEWRQGRIDKTRLVVESKVVRPDSPLEIDVDRFLGKHEEPERPADVPASRRPRGQSKDKPARKQGGQAGSKVTCKRCGFVGGNARGCGTAHETQVVSPAAVDGGASEETKAEANKRRGKLPTPRSSFEVEGGEVTELDFGGED